MCELCRQSRMLMSAGTGGAASGGAMAAGSSSAARGLPEGSGQDGRRLLIKGGAVLSMDPAVGDFAEADILIEGKKIVEIGPNLSASDAGVVDAKGMIVMPGLIDTHHHQFETALRSFLADGLLMADGLPHGAVNYYDYILQKFSVVYRPEDVYISEIFGSLAQLDAGVTGVLDVSQIHHSPEHSDAAIKASMDAGRRTAFGYFEGWGDKLKYPEDARRIVKEHFSSDDQLVTFIMGGEIYIPGWENAWKVGRELGVPVALHVLSPFGMVPTFDQMAKDRMFGPDNIFIHMTGMSDFSWDVVADSGAHVSLAVPIEMTMRHGTPPIQKCLDLGIQPSLSTDVECTMTACMFTQMRSAMTLQRMQVNQRALDGEEKLPEILNTRDVIRFATVEAAKGLHLDKKIGSLTPGKEADMILLDATHINTAPLNHVPGAVVTLMERSNVDTVLVAGKIRKWKGALLDVDLKKLRTELEASRDYIFEAAGVPQNLFRRPDET